MQNILFPVIQVQINRKNVLQAVLVNAIVNTLIAFFLRAIQFGDSFISVFVFSQSIGMSILAASLAVVPLFKRTSQAKVQLLIIMGSILFGSIAGTILGAGLNRYHPIEFIRQNFNVFSQIVFLGLVFGTIITYVFLSLGRLAAEKLMRAEAEKHSIEAELKLLQSQMEPHFLFNTLSNVLSLIETEPVKAKKMLESFTAFLRSSLVTARDKTVLLSQEIELVKNYLEIYSLRMGSRLRYRIDVPDDLLGVSLPPLLIQPLVENAIKHGLEPSRNGGEVTVEVARAGGVVGIVVRDTGIGMEEKSVNAGAGIGLENLRKRMDLLFGSTSRMMVEENQPSGIKVTLEVPYEAAAGDNR